MAKITLPKGTIVPNHIAIVLDGNGRWARARGKNATKGHEAADKIIDDVINAAKDLGVHTLTLWAWSTENWKRPPAEIKKIFELVKRAITRELATAQEQGVRFHHLGRKDRLPKDLLRILTDAEEKTKNNTKYVLNAALDYGGRDEILRAVRKIVIDGVPAPKIDENLFSSYLDTADQPYPNPDLFIRTSGEQRTSGLMPWQMVYSEFYFEQDHLPSMTPEKLREAILDYSRRRRRYGAKDKVKHLDFKPELTANLELQWWRLRNIPEGTGFGQYAVQHLVEQYGLSKKLAGKAAKYMLEAVVHGDKKRWAKSTASLKSFYKLIKDEVKLAFEPSVVASMEVKLWKDLNGKDKIEGAMDAEDSARELYAEVYRISLFQAAKLAHLRVLAAVERNMAEAGMGEQHWEKAEDYLEKFYSALKERVA